MDVVPAALSGSPNIPIPLFLPPGSEFAATVFGGLISGKGESNAVTIIDHTSKKIYHMLIFFGNACNGEPPDVLPIEYFLLMS
jgi:hypothetical protein